MEPDCDQIDPTRPDSRRSRQLSHLSRLGGVKGLQRVRRPRVRGSPPAPDLDDRSLPVDLGQDVDFPSAHSQIASQYQMASALQETGSQRFGGPADVPTGEMVSSGIHSSGMPPGCDIRPRSVSLTSSPELCQPRPIVLDPAQAAQWPDAKHGLAHHHALVDCPEGPAVLGFGAVVSHHEDVILLHVNRESLLLCGRPQIPLLQKPAVHPNLISPNLDSIPSGGDHPLDQGGL